MRPHPRIWKVLAWSSTFAVAMIATAWLVTRFASIVYRAPGGSWCSVWGDGCEVCVIWQPLPTNTGPGWKFFLVRTASEWWPHVMLRDTIWLLRLPFWMLLIPTGTVACISWRAATSARRRAMMHACPVCSYDRSGIAPESPCPECGRAA